MHAYPTTMNAADYYPAPAAEPLPSATDNPEPVLTIPQLAEFASSMVYLMWRARRPSVMALHKSSATCDSPYHSHQFHNRNPNPHYQHADAESREIAHIAKTKSAGFKRFCSQVLQATQLSESVVMLSLKYIAMLLQNSPQIQGAEGSEYRMFTVALMLGMSEIYYMHVCTWVSKANIT